MVGNVSLSMRSAAGRSTLSCTVPVRPSRLGLRDSRSSVFFSATGAKFTDLSHVSGRRAVLAPAPSGVDKREARLYHIRREFTNSTPSIRPDCHVVS